MGQIAYVNSKENIGGFAEFGCCKITCSIGKRRFLGQFKMAPTPEEIIVKLKTKGFEENVVFAKELAILVRLNRYERGLMFVGVDNPGLDTINFEFHWLERKDIPGFVGRETWWIDDNTLAIDLS
jgi:hypothetical protein